jgi:hypothetical protein
MSKRIWGTLDDYLPPLQGSTMVGRGFVNYNFIKAFFEHSSFDEYHFFLNNRSHKEEFLTHHEAMLTGLGVADTVHKIIQFTETPKPISDIMKNCNTGRKSPFYQVMWMLKHGLLRLSPGPPHGKRG